MSTPDVGQLQQELYSTLKGVEKKRKLLSISQRVMYLMVLGWFLFLGYNYYALTHYEQEEIVVENIGTKEEPIYTYNNSHDSVIKVVLIIFGVLFVSQFVFAGNYTAFNEQEQNIISKIVRTLFPKAEYSRYANAPTPTIVHSSKLFTGISRHSNALMVNLFASLKIRTEGKDLFITDLGLSKAIDSDTVGAILKPYKILLSMFFKSLSGGRSENLMLDFRGMFAWIEFEEMFKGHVVILPDHLEGKLGYLAKSIQSMKDVGGNQLVTMEDPEFEKYFAVYASDEVFARYILTPSMMRDITQLREKYGRDIMVSFTGKRFYFAVYMPDGFLNLRAGSLTKERNVVEEIYTDIQTVTTISEELNLKQRSRFATV